MEKAASADLAPKNSLAWSNRRQILTYRLDSFLGARSLRSLHNLADVYLAQNRPAEAEPLYGNGLALRRKVLGPSHHQTLDSLRALVATLTALGKFEEAEPLALECYQLQQNVNEPDNGKARQVIELIVQLYTDWGKPEQASEWRAKLATTELAAESANP